MSHNESVRSKRPHSAALIIIFTAIITLCLLPYHLSSFRPDMAEADSFLNLNDFVRENVMKRPFLDVGEKKVEPIYHMVFSTSCSPQQDWESFVFFYHAMKVKQPGNITRIASGCTPDQAQKLTLFHKQYVETMSPHFYLHLTPDFSRVALDNGRPYKYMNKPFGLRHWMEHGYLRLSPNRSFTPQQDDILMLMDPDMFLLRPLRHDFTDETVVWVEVQPATKVVRHGLPIAQQDAYLGSNWMDLNISYIVNGLNLTQSYVPPPVTEKEGPIHWNSGPPYLATVTDMYSIVVRWSQYAPRVMHVFPTEDRLFVEMFGFIIASLQLNLPFTFIKSLVVSDPESSREAWKEYIDTLPTNQSCSVPPDAPMPVGFHYCQRYMLGKWFFSKYRVKKTVMECDQSLLAVPPDDIGLVYDYAIKPPRADLKDLHEPRKRFETKPVLAKREAFSLCRMIPAFNEALRYYKLRACKDGGNLSETLSVHDDPKDY